MGASPIAATSEVDDDSDDDADHDDDDAVDGEEDQVRI